MDQKIIVLATHNAGKIRELQEILTPLGYSAVPVRTLLPDIEEPEETGQTFAENALLKATYYMKASGKPCLADDSGIIADVLDGIEDHHICDGPEGLLQEGGLAHLAGPRNHHHREGPGQSFQAWAQKAGGQHSINLMMPSLNCKTFVPVHPKTGPGRPGPVQAGAGPFRA